MTGKLVLASEPDALRAIRWGEPPLARKTKLTKPVRHALDSLLPPGTAHRPLDYALVIRTRDSDLSLKELAAYLSFADRIYGRITFGSLRDYSRHRDSHLSIGEVGRGSLILVLRELIEAATTPQGLVLTGLVLKFLPDIIKAPTAAYRDVAEARYRNAERRHLLQRAAADAELRALAPRDVSRLVGVLLDLYEQEHGRIASAQAFAIDAVEEIRIERRGRD